MVKSKIALLGLFILSFCVSVGTMHKFFPKQKVIYQTINTHPKTAYFTVWSDNVFTLNRTLKHLSHELSKPENGGYATNTPPHQDIELHNKNDLNIVVWQHFEIPLYKITDRSYLWQIESPISIKIPPTEIYKTYFNKIFTYHKPSCDGKKVIHVPIPYNYEKIIKNYDFSKKDILLMHVGTFYQGYNYIQREKAISWFLENHPKDILFYGAEWHNLKQTLSKKAQIHFEKQYGGYIPDKIKTISRAKFVLAFENERFEDYVSEKIYDAMAAGSVPIYSGAPNITDYVPQACFIDFHKFKNHKELYKYISTMPKKTYKSYMNCIETFMKNPEKHPNHPTNVVSTILSHIDNK